MLWRLQTVGSYGCPSCRVLTVWRSRNTGERLHYGWSKCHTAEQLRDLVLTIQLIPLGVTFSNAVSKLKAQSSLSELIVDQYIKNTVA